MKDITPYDPDTAHLTSRQKVVRDTFRVSKDRNAKPTEEKALAHLKDRAKESRKKIDAFMEGGAMHSDGPIHHIDDMPSLKKRLGKSKAAAVRASLDGVENSGEEPKASNREKRIVNTTIGWIHHYSVNDLSNPVDDIISGIANLDHYNQKGRNIPLSKTSMYVILKNLSVITTNEVKALLNVGDRQARVYVRAMRLVIRFIDASVERGEIDTHPDSDLEDKLDDYVFGVYEEYDF